ncbi:MAG TPA: hypothetical protein VHK91_09445, partial [Flavisolibacter sp.]|nr:hypothetical protein [Flavisolibacter sp.]
MKLLLTIGAGILLSINTARAQDSLATVRLRRQAFEMSQALLDQDYKTFVVYTYPKVVKMMGGTEKMLQVLRNGKVEMEQKGMRFDSVALEEPGPLLRSGTAYQSLIIEHLIIKVPGGKLYSTSTLIAFSPDAGKTWTFLDVSNKE